MSNPHSNVAPGPVIVAFNNHVFGLDETTGARLWRFDFQGAFGSGHVVRLEVADDVVYALGSGGLACLEVRSGRLIGQIKLAMIGSMCTLLAARDRILIGSGDGTVKCFSRTGQLLWEDGFKGEGGSAVALAFAGRTAQGDVAR